VAFAIFGADEARFDGGDVWHGVDSVARPEGLNLLAGENSSSTGMPSWVLMAG
jgi:hypothetical protein